MQVRCVHGYFFFVEDSIGELSRVASLYGLNLVAKDWYYTFPELADAPRWSLKNFSYLTGIGTVNFAGHPWDVMRENKLTFDFRDGIVKPIAAISLPLALGAAPNYFFADGLILPGSVTTAGARVTDFTGSFTSDAIKFRYTEVLYDNYP